MNELGQFIPTHDQSFAWGPDLSGTDTGAGGIGGLAVISDTSAAVTSSYVPVMDAQGNVTTLLDTSLNQAARYEYGPYGETMSAVGAMALRNPFRFSTKHTDVETGLVYYGFRYYAPGIGRWVSRDLIEERGGLNTCGFVENRPTLLVDKLGLSGLDPSAVYAHFTAQVFVEWSGLAYRIHPAAWLISQFVQPGISLDLTAMANLNSCEVGVFLSIAGFVTGGVGFNEALGAGPVTAQMFPVGFTGRALPGAPGSVTNIGLNLGFAFGVGLAWGLPDLQQYTGFSSSLGFGETFSLIPALGVPAGFGLTLSGNSWDPFGGSYFTASLEGLFGFPTISVTYSRGYTWLLAGGKLPPALCGCSGSSGLPAAVRPTDTDSASAVLADYPWSDSKITGVVRYLQARASSYRMWMDKNEAIRRVSQQFGVSPP